MQEKTIEIAKLCHQMNKIYCEQIGDNSQPNWEDAPDWQKKSAITGVIYHLYNDFTNPEDSHNNWMREKIDDGWVYGELKDEKLKTHPSILPFNELTKEEQFKDVLFTTIVKFFK